MKLAKYLLILGLFIFLASFVSATDSYVKRVYGSCSSNSFQKWDGGSQNGQKSIDFDYIRDTVTGKDSPFFNSQDWGILTDVRGGEIEDSYYSSAGEPSSSSYFQDCSGEGCPRDATYSSGSGWSKGVYTGGSGFLEYGCLDGICNYFVADFKQRVANTIECDCNKVTYSYQGVYGPVDDPDWNCNADISYTEIWTGKPVVPAGVECKPCGKVELKLDDTYRVKTKKDRLFTPSIDKATAFDNYVCELVVDRDEASAIDTLTKTAKLITTDKDRKEEEINSGKLGNGKISSDGKKVTYSWNITGWKDENPPGIAKDNAGMEKLIANKNVKCEVTIGTDKIKSDLIPLSNCVHVWGSDGTAKDEHGKIIPATTINVIYMNPTDTLPGDPSKGDFSWVIKEAEKVRKEGFKQVDPFKSYPLKFGHYTDLARYPEYSEYPKIFDLTENSCGVPFNQNNIQFAFGVILAHGIASKSGYRLLLTKGYYDSRVAMHEFTHAFCRVQDEYLYTGKRETRDNCKLLSDLWPESFGGAYTGCTWRPFFRSSSNSLMRNPRADSRLNIVSCGYCLQKIDGSKEPIETYWGECKEMDTIKPGTEICKDDTDCAIEGSGDNLFERNGGNYCRFCDKNGKSLGVCKNVQDNPKTPCTEVIGSVNKFGLCASGLCQINNNMQCLQDGHCNREGESVGCLKCTEAYECVKKDVNSFCQLEFGSGDYRSGKCNAAGICILD